MKNYRWCLVLQVWLVLQVIATEAKLAYARHDLLRTDRPPEDAKGYAALGRQLEGGLIGGASFLLATVLALCLIVAAIAARKQVSWRKRASWLGVALICPSLIAMSTYWWRYSRGWW